MDRSEKVSLIAAGIVLAVAKLVLLALPHLPLEVLSGLTDTLLCLLIAVAAWRAGRGTAGFTRTLWHCIAVSAFLWAANSLWGSFEFSSHPFQEALRSLWRSDFLVYTVWILMTLPLLLGEEGEEPGRDGRRLLDIAQLAIVSLAAFLVFYYIPQNAEESVRKQLHLVIPLHWLRDGSLAIGYFYHGWRSRSAGSRRLQWQLAACFLMLSLTASFYFEALALWHLPTLVLDFVVDLPGIYLLVLAVTWRLPEPVAVTPASAQRSRQPTLWTQLLPLLVPLAVVMMAQRATQAYLRLAWMAVVASFVVYAARVVLTQHVQQRASEALSQSEAKYQRLVESMAEIVYVLAPDGTVTYISPAVEQILGYRPEEMIGQNIMRYVHAPDAEAGQKRMQ